MKARFRCYQLVYSASAAGLEAKGVFIIRASGFVALSRPPLSTPTGTARDASSKIAKGQGIVNHKDDDKCVCPPCLEIWYQKMKSAVFLSLSVSAVVQYINGQSSAAHGPSAILIPHPAHLTPPTTTPPHVLSAHSSRAKFVHSARKSNVRCSLESENVVLLWKTRRLLSLRPGLSQATRKCSNDTIRSRETEARLVVALGIYV
ncbi:hypothetical protein GALMADRAFT_579140 [Galerina marginata CBS 339.88]|uniref:Uncharacterized protein n=1 Tax=Galerina marginata (strain CBS 339.88) TaxID=685588 RepID=A0A067T325_GALM3|nr:hypothetical protein GALMADRAFT_579140 [Galerina marginata CBS 339.88]